jgi:hypothetical protein
MVNRTIAQVSCHHERGINYALCNHVPKWSMVCAGYSESWSHCLRGIQKGRVPGLDSQQQMTTIYVVSAGVMPMYATMHEHMAVDHAIVESRNNLWVSIYALPKDTHATPTQRVFLKGKEMVVKGSCWVEKENE